LMC